MSVTFAKRTDQINDGLRSLSVIRSLLTFTPIQGFFDQQSDEVPLPYPSSQSVDPVLRALTSTKVKGFVKDSRLGHSRVHTDTAFLQPVLNRMIDEYAVSFIICGIAYKGNLMMKRVAIYTRVSTDSQTVENQHRELKAVTERLGWTIVAELADEGFSGTKVRDQRPAFDRLMQMVTRREIDIIACWSVDRLGRSLQHLITFLNEINDRGVDLYLHTQGLDTSTPAGRAMFSMLSVFAEFERSILKERIMAGLRRSTKKSGRPPLDPDKVEKIRRELNRGTSINATARKLRCGVGTVHRIKTRMTA